MMVILASAIAGVSHNAMHSATIFFMGIPRMKTSPDGMKAAKKSSILNWLPAPQGQRRVRL